MLKRFGMVASVLALLAVALAGCKNGMLGEDEATVNGLRDVGNNKVALIVTNFENKGVFRSIAPTEIDLKLGGYTYVAEATMGRAKWGPEKVTVDGNARVDLSGLTAGLWAVTITAYEDALLTRNGVADPGNADVNNIIATAANTAVLSGTATVDVTGGTTEARITLTPWGMGENGALNVSFKFHADDITKIVAATGDYEITAGIYNRHTGVVIQDTLGASTEKTVDNPAVGADTKQYTQTDKIAKGEYTLKLSIKNTRTGKSASWSDVLIVEGNRTITTTVDLPKLLDEAPKDPENFAAYWDQDQVNKEGVGYVMQFAWDRKSFNETEFVLEVADITGKFDKSAANAVRYDGVDVANGEQLWQKIDADPDKTVYSFNKDNFSSPLSFPIYAKNGSVFAGSSSVEYRLMTGTVYTARIKAINDFGESNWIYLGGGADPASAWTGGNKERLDDNTEFIFDIFTITYDLGNYVLLKDGQQVAAGQKSTVMSIKYDINTPHTIDFPEYSAQNQGDYQLYLSTFGGTAGAANPERLEWSGWKNELETGNVVYNKAKSYDGHKDAKLKPVGTGVAGSSAVLDVISGGTTANIITERTLLVSDAMAAQQADTLESNNGSDISTTTPGLGRANGVYGINRSVAGNLINATTLYFSIGETVPTGAGDQFQEGKVKDAQNRVHTVISATYELRKNNTTYVEATGKPAAQLDVTALPSGPYTLFVTVVFSSGNTGTYQTPFIVKCVDESL